MAKRKYITVLLVDDEEFVLERLAQFLIAQGSEYLVYKATNGKDAMKWLERNQPDILVTGLLMPHMDGLQLVQNFVALYPHTPVIMMSRDIQGDSILQAYELGVCKFLPIPFNGVEFLNSVRAALGAAKSNTLHIFPLPLEDK